MQSQDGVLVLNAGSSSVKFCVFPAQSTTVDAPLISGKATGLNQAQEATLTLSDATNQTVIPLDHNDHSFAVDTILSYLNTHYPAMRIVACGHRVVHGGEQFSQPTLVTHAVKQAIQEYAEFAPLHNPVNLIGIKQIEQTLPDLPQVAVFDTAFHATLPESAFRYAIPEDWYSTLGIRRFGFHGINHQYIAETLHTLLPQSQQNLVSVHLGNGCSLCAIRNGQSLDTSMGFTPLEGLVMGTRSGDFDPGLFEFLQRKTGLDIEHITHKLNTQSGLLGVSGRSADMKILCEQAGNGDMKAERAIDLFCYRAAKYIASYLVALGRIDAIAFTGGIGENAPDIRQRIITRLAALGFELDPIKNQQPAAEICPVHRANTKPVFIIPAREEYLIAQQTLRLLHPL